MKEKYYRIIATVELDVPVDSIPIELFIEEGGEYASQLLEKVASNEIDVDITKYFAGLEGEFIKVKSGIFENMACGWITKVVGHKIVDVELEEVGDEK